MNTDQGRELSEEFYNMFKELKKSLKSENIDDSKSLKNTHEERMEELVKRYDPYRELHKPVEYIRNGIGLWFTCLIYLKMNPTNNPAKKAISEHVAIRKINWNIQV